MVDALGGPPGTAIGAGALVAVGGLGPMSQAREALAAACLVLSVPVSWTSGTCQACGGRVGWRRGARRRHIEHHEALIAIADALSELHRPP